MKKYLLLLPVLCAIFCSCAKDTTTEVVKYVDRVDTLYVNNRDTVKVPEYFYIHDTIRIEIQVPTYIYRTDTLYMSQDGREVSPAVVSYINNNWQYIRERMSDCFTIDGVTRIYVYISKYIFHMTGTNSTDMVVFIATKNGVLNSVVYYGADYGIGGDPSTNPYGRKYPFPNSISGLNPMFFDSPLIGIYTSTPGYYPFQ